MSQENHVLNESFVQRARELVDSMEAGSGEEAERLLDELTKMRENSLFQELGRLTREFHEALNGFRLDSRLSHLAQQDIPDARERLNYVITMTNQAADRTLTAVEESMPICDRLQEQNRDVSERWDRFTRREMDAAEFRDLSRDLTGYLSATADNLPLLRDNLQEVLMAQDFQDLTGQIIRRVITLVEDLEKSLVDLVRISGQNLIPEDKKKSRDAKGEDRIEATGPPVPGVDGETVSGQDEVDDLLSSLGF